MNVDDLFFSAEPAEMARGCAVDGDGAVCLLCGRRFDRGRIYEVEGALYNADGAAKAHVAAEHGEVFRYLIGLSPDLTGLAPAQRTVLTRLYEGDDDEQIAKALGGRSRSTVRGHRFALRQRERQARIFLAIMSLADSRTGPDEFKLHKGVTLVDERFAITQKDREAVERSFIRDGRLIALPTREKRRLIVVQILAERFERGRDYTEKEVNAVIEPFYGDYAQLRRYLVSYGYLDRERDGSRYWVK